jgi:site-specific recombinase XerD
MNLNIYLDSKPDKDNLCQLFFYLSANGKRSKISSGIKIEPENWINNRITKNELNYDLKNTLLQTKQSLINRIITEAKMKLLNPDPEEIKKEYTYRIKLQSGTEQLTQKHLLIDLLKNYQLKYQPIFKPQTIRSINQVISHIEAFQPDVYIEDINHDWISRYFAYLISKELQDSTIKSRHLKTLKTIGKEATRLKIPVSDELFQYTWKAPKKQPFFATWEEVQAIEAIKDFNSKTQELVRDMFILSCYTGLRFSDFNKIHRSNIVSQDGQTMLRVITTKTGFDYSIPINSSVFSILEKYRFTIPTVSQQEFNREIKNVARIVVKGTFQNVSSSGSKTTTEQIQRHKMFSSHTGRRSFARRMLDKGASIVTTMGYVGYQPSEIIKEFNKVFG